MSEPQILFFLTKLQDPARRDDYERWVRDVDTPSVMAWECTTDYRVVRLAPDAVLKGVGLPDYDYIEIMEVSSLDAYQADVAGSPPELFDGFSSHIGPFEAVIGTVVR